MHYCDFERGVLFTHFDCLFSFFAKIEKKWNGTKNKSTTELQ